MREPLAVRTEWPWLLAVLWVAAAASRWLTWQDDLFGLVLARDWGRPPDDVVPPLRFLPALWAQAPLAHAALWPAASLGAPAFHAAQAVLAGAVAPAAALALAPAGRAWSLVAGLAAALHPAILGAAPSPAALALPLLVLGLVASERGRHGWACGSLAAAGGFAASAALAALALAVLGAGEAVRRGSARLWPLDLDLRTTAFLWAGLAGLLPLAYASLVLDARAVAEPGWGMAALAALPLAAVGAAGFVLPGVRAWWAAGLGSWALGAVAAATGFLDATAFLASSALLLIAVLRLAASSRRLPGRKGLAALASTAVALAVVASAAAAWPQPGHAASGSESAREALELVPPSMRGSVFAVDLRWQDIPWLAGEVGVLGWAWTGGVTETEAWRLAVEDVADATLLRVDGTPLNEALREVYADCVVASGAGHVVIAGQGCKGRGDPLRAAKERPGS